VQLLGDILQLADALALQFGDVHGRSVMDRRSTPGDGRCCGFRNPLTGRLEENRSGVGREGSRPVRPGLDNRAISWGIGTILMVGETLGKPDASAFGSVIADHRVAVQGDTEVMRARLLPGLHGSDPRVRALLDAWGGQAYLHEDAWGTEIVTVRTMPGRPPRWRLHLILFVLTLLSTLAAGALMQGADPFATRFVAGGWLAYPTGFDP